MLFAVFATVYFLLHSPGLGAVDTFVRLIVGLVSLACASRLERAATYFILLRVLWLALASCMPKYIALSNQDPFLGSGPLL